MKKIELHGISLPAETHSLILGSPGVGKTRSILRPLLHQYLTRHADDPERKAGLLLLDAKGDMLEWLRATLKSLGREDDLVVIGEREDGFNLFGGLPLSAGQYAARLTSCANSASRITDVRGDSEFWHHQQRQLLEVLIQVAKLQCRDRPVQIADVVCLRFQLLPKLKGSFEKATIQYRLDELGDGKRVLQDFASLPNDTRECVLATISNCLSVFHQAPLIELMNPTTDKSVDLAGIVEKGQCVVISCATRSYGDSTIPLLRLIKEAFSDIILCRGEIEVGHGEGFKRLNPDREILYVADECHRIIRRGDEGGELDFLDLCREQKCRAILATQSISSLESVMGVIAARRLVSLIGNYFFMNSIDPASSEWADRMFALPQPDTLPPPLLISRHSGLVPVEWDGPQTLSRLQLGEFLLRTQEGKLYRKKVRLPRLQH